MANRGSHSSSSPGQFSLAWLIGYLVIMALVSGSVIYGRRRALDIYGSSTAQSQWDTWREDAKKMAQQPSPVNRRIPGSAEPPALVLMRDYFAVCLALALVLSTILFVTFMFFIRGALRETCRVGSAHHRI